MTQDDIDLADRLQERLEAGNDDPWGGALRFEAWSRPAMGFAASLVVSMVWGMLRSFDFGRGLEALAIELNEAVVATFHLEKT